MTQHKNHQRPTRQRKADRILQNAATAAEIQCDYLVGPVDALAVQMDRKWGIDRLPEIVSVETAAKYGSAMAKFNAAIQSADPAETATRAAVCLRGLQAMDAEAEASGAAKADPTIIEYDLDGFVFGVMPDGRNWMAAQEARPDLKLYTMREIGVVLKSLSGANGMIAEAKKLGGAEIIRISEKTTLPKDFFESGGDPIPF